MSSRYALSILHFNIEFVAGDIATYHMNVKESLEPLLNVLLENPTWKTDIEMQGLYIEILKENYPETLEKLRKLVNRKQVELVSAHYSDQIYVAYPRYDLLKSIDINDKILEENGLKRSNVFLTQENFFTPAVTKVIKEKGYDIALINHTYYDYFHKIDPEKIKPLYKLDKLYIVMSGPESQWLIPLKENGIQWVWWWYDDGEPLMTLHGPYSFEKFKHTKLKEDRMKIILSGLERQGYRLETISNFVKEIVEKGYRPEKLKMPLEGAWNMKRCEGVYRWMGHYHNPWELDVQIRSLTYTSRKYVLAAEKLIKNVKDTWINTESLEKLLEEAWRFQLRAECSDPTGWSPKPNEVGYSITMARLAQYYSLKIIEDVKKELRYEKILIDTWTGEIKEIKEMPKKYRKTSLPIQLEYIGTKPSISSYLVEENVYLIKYSFKPQEKYAGFMIPIKTSKIYYSRALAEEELYELDLDSYDFDHVYLPLTNGLISFTEQDFIIKNNEKMHIAAKIDKNLMKIGFIVENAPQQLVFDWEFYYVKGNKEKALKKALEINVYPKLIV